MGQLDSRKLDVSELFISRVQQQSGLVWGTAEASRVVAGVGEAGGWRVVYFDGPACGSLATHG